MSIDHFEDRLTVVERGQAQLASDFRVLSHDVGTLKDEVRAVGEGVKSLVAREARRPDPISIKTIATTIITTGAVIGMLAGFVWWVIQASPAVEDLDRRVTELDHPRIGRVPAVERELKAVRERLSAPSAWRTE